MLPKAYCGDDQFFTFSGTKKRQCSFILKRKPLAFLRRRNLCEKYEEIQDACQWSCGHCSDSIVDDPTFEITLTNGKKKPCSWIAQSKKWFIRKNRRNKYCSMHFADVKVEDACKLSCANYEIPINRQQRRKLGVISSDQNTNLVSYEHFGNVASWTYNFKTLLPMDQGNFADENGIEYVPMIAHAYLIDKNCEFEQGAYTYLMGFNEPYIDKPAKFIEPAKAVDYWVKFIQPAAKANNLKLISPSSRWGGHALDWLIDFLKVCFENIECDLDLIYAFNLHMYTCKEDLWLSKFRGVPTNFENDAVDLIGEFGGKDWRQFFASRKVWITETHCGKNPPEPKDRSSDAICRIITGQTQGYGHGSVFAIENLHSIERYAWWTVFNKATDSQRFSNNFLTYEDGQLTPAGRALMDPTNTEEGKCDFRGIRVLAEKATLSGKAELFQCQSTGTNMIRRLGQSQSTATFTVNVESAGDYAANVSLMNVGQEFRHLGISLNDGSTQIFAVGATDEKWCTEGGTPLVVPLELKGFVKGQNSIRIGEDIDGYNFGGPIIEWIQIVPKQ